MEQKNQVSAQLQVLAARLNLIKPDEEPEAYILTQEEETEVIRNAIAELKKHRLFKLTSLSGYNIQTAEIEVNKVNWEERIDREDLLAAANSRKHHALWLEKQRLGDSEELKRLAEAERKKKEELMKKFNANYFFNVMSWTAKNVFGKNLKVNEETKFLIKVICFFMSRDPRFETELGFSLKKGLLVRGISGLGKTFLFECVQQNEVRPLAIYSMLTISQHVQDDGGFDLNHNRFIYLDDVGTEEPVVTYYGTKINFFKEFIELYYMEKRPDYSNLIISTNNNFDELEKKYGFRVRSRTKDMFNTINVIGTDMRGQD